MEIDGDWSTSSEFRMMQSLESLSRYILKVESAFRGWPNCLGMGYVSYHIAYDDLEAARRSVHDDALLSICLGCLRRSFRALN